MSCARPRADGVVVIGVIGRSETAVPVAVERLLDALRAIARVAVEDCPTAAAIAVEAALTGLSEPAELRMCGPGGTMVAYAVRAGVTDAPESLAKPIMAAVRRGYRSGTVMGWTWFLD